MIKCFNQVDVDSAQIKKKLLQQQLQSSDYELENLILINWGHKYDVLKSEFTNQRNQIYLPKNYRQFVIYYYAYQNQYSAVRVFQDNMQNYNSFIQITKLLALGSLFGVLIHIYNSDSKIKVFYKSILQIINTIFILVIFYQQTGTVLYHEIFKFQLIFWMICLNIFEVSKKCILLFALFLFLPNDNDYQTIFRMVGYSCGICFYMAKYQHKQISCKKNFVVLLLSMQLIVFSFHNFLKQASFSFGFNMIRMVIIIMGHLMTIKKMDHFQIKQIQIKKIRINQQDQQLSTQNCSSQYIKEGQQFEMQSYSKNQGQ